MNQYIGNLIIRIVLELRSFTRFSKVSSGIDNVAGWFTSIGLPGLLAYVATVELSWWLLLIIGLGNDM